jgi:hypothetical protein
VEITIAAICKRGHLQTLEAQTSYEGFCGKCGAAAITKCAACDTPIYGVPLESDEYGNLDTSRWKRSDFCLECGAAYPWVDRQGRIWALENLLDEEKTDQATRLAVREQLEALTDGDLSDKDQVKHWKRVRQLSPELWSRGANIVQDLVTDYAKQKLGI